MGFFSSDRNRILVLGGAAALVCVLVLSLNFFLNRASRAEGPGEAQETESPPDPFRNIEEIGRLGQTERNPGEESVDSENTIEIQQDEKESVRRPAFDIPEAGGNAVLCFVFDDAGQSAEKLRPYLDLPFPLAVSVLPGLVRSAECAELVRRSGKELMLHQPMQAENLELSPGPDAVSPMMSTKEISEVVEKNLKSLGEGVRGVNNHEGSLITANIVKIGAVLEVCKARGVYFLDSRTTAQSKVVEAALELDAGVLVRNAPFIDNEVDREKILARIFECLSVANLRGFAVIIGHVDKSVDVLPELLSALYPELLGAGYSFAFPSELQNQQNQ